MSEEVKRLINYLQEFANDEREEKTKYGVEISQDNTKSLINYIEQLQKEHNILTEFEKWLEERESFAKINPVISGTIKGALDKLRELKGDKNEP